MQGLSIATWYHHSTENADSDDTQHEQIERPTRQHRNIEIESSSR